MRLFKLSPALLLAAVGCSDSDGGSGTSRGSAKEGESCQRTSDCEGSLLCAGDSTCQRAGEPGTAAKGDNCSNPQGCRLGLVCGSNGKCADPGTGGAGADCRGPEDCLANFACAADGKCAQSGSPGTKGPGADCEQSSECSLGLVCLGGSCNAVSFWAGVSCTDPEGDFRALFEVPRTGQALDEFYRLPFPNDIRRKDGNVDVSGHPNPGTALPLGFGDVVGEYIKAINRDVTGFGVNTTVLMRLSQTADLNTLTPRGENPTVQFINIDKDSDRYARGISFAMGASTGGGKYICPNWVSARPAPFGAPLQPETTYAVLLREGIKKEDGTAAVQDADFAAMVSETEPTDADLKAAWDVYKPLREYLADQEINPATVLSAAVFTTMNPRRRMAKIREAVRDETSASAAAVSQLTLCDGTSTSPCDDGSTGQACPTQVDPAFDELQGLYKTPVFQQGTAPYKLPANGGAIDYDTDGKPMVVREDDVCVAMSIPKGPMPEGGWPVVIFGHGTGGSYRTFINNGTAAALADIKDGGGADLAKMAVISIDGAMHGPRRNSEDEPDGLFFNLANPAAARDNTYQGAADKFQLVRVIEALSLDAGASPTGAALRFNTQHLYLFGHSQGTIEGIPFAAYEPLVRGVVLSGAGGYLLSSLLDKTKPVNVAAAVQFALADSSLMSAGTNHPLLNLLQLYFEEVDTLNYGRQLLQSPPEGVDAKHVFLSYGLTDNFTPATTIEALTRVMSLPRVDQPAERCGDGICRGSETCSSCSDDCGANNCDPRGHPFAGEPPPAPVSAPVSENISLTGDQKRTAAVVPYVSDGSFDDHFVIFRTANGLAQSTRFLGTAVKNGAPTIEAAAP